MGDGSEGEWICVPRLAVKTYLLIVHVAVRGSIKTRPSPLSIFCRLVLLYHLSFLSNKGPSLLMGNGGGGGGGSGNGREGGHLVSGSYPPIPSPCLHAAIINL